MTETNLTPDQIQRIANALGDPNRYDILKRIYASDAALTCGCAKGGLSISDGTCSHHLKELLAADLINMDRDGRYRLLTPRRDIWDAFLASLQQL
ncbi:ArsR/SmtB family transcription factor [Granulicella arctica]|uniref:ArsR/SmtB family transcription factor n=1 Tax=Granulicella arctica TaxID=940613 RepID=UPI0021DFC206|nr:helix-turn-helix domain-containing protein [Granulicella arctica]